MVRGAFDNPIVQGMGGRPHSDRGEQPLVELVVVAKEAHSDGSPHFHAAVKLFSRMRFKAAKATLSERHQLASHWSCTHSQLWSALQYIYTPSPGKPRVDEELFVWTHDGQELDLAEKSRQPFVAAAWRKRRECKESKAHAESKRVPAFTKLDLTALVLSKHLHTKASLLSYVQDHGTPEAMLFVTKNQRRLTAFIEDAQEWAEAKADCALEKLSEWGILCKAGTSACSHRQGECRYAKAAAEIFERNRDTLSPHRLACALKSVLLNGPSKTCRVPLLVGPSNTGKSTLLYPFDDMFGPKHVFHKPALGSTFALRNIVKHRRFIFWDDFRPVEFAHAGTIPVATFLSLFIGKDTEIQVSQSFNDGNLDVCWKRGVVFTAKMDGLWTPTTKVSAEDVRHLKNRVEEFCFMQTLTSLEEVDSCAPCMARWIMKYSDEAAAGRVPLPLTADSRSSGSGHVVLLAEVLAVAGLPEALASSISAEVAQVGVEHVRELGLADWQALPSWRFLSAQQVCRVVAAAGWM